MESWARREEADRTRKAAHRSTDSLASWESGEYWAFRKQEAEASLTINEIDSELAEDSTEAEQRKFLKRKARLEEETETAARTIRRYEARSRVIETAKTTNPVSMRVSYLELMTSKPADLVWSPVRGDWVERGEKIKAAHMFPLSIGQETMTYLFGEDADGEISKAANGLFLPFDVEEKLDRYQVVIVPCETETKPQEWKFLVLDRGGLWNTALNSLGKDCTFADGDFRTLPLFPAKGQISVFPLRLGNAPNRTRQEGAEGGNKQSHDRIHGTGCKQGVGYPRAISPRKHDTSLYRGHRS
ncbi:hypothetical protein MMC07_004636 [Pseudocyphellaria aurata]|nr:hypothetical protein [Pseudocyphellaria aurata]